MCLLPVYITPTHEWRKHSPTTRNHFFLQPQYFTGNLFKWFAHLHVVILHTAATIFQPDFTNSATKAFGNSSIIFWPQLSGNLLGQSGDWIVAKKGTRKHTWSADCPLMITSFLLFTLPMPDKLLSNLFVMFITHRYHYFCRRMFSRVTFTKFI